MIKIPPPEKRFSTNAVCFCGFVGELATSFYERGYDEVDPRIIGMVKSFLEIADPSELIRNFITYSKKYWGQIELREEGFMRDHAMEIFNGLPVEHIASFRKVFYVKDNSGNPLLTDEDKSVIWKYFDSFVSISKKYEDVHGVVGNT